MSSESVKLSDGVLEFDKDAEVEKICNRIKEILRIDLNRRGLVIAMSGGIDSSVSAALCVKALGPKKVFGLLLPEQDSSSDSTVRGKLLAEHLGIEYLVHDIAPTLEAIGCYQDCDYGWNRRKDQSFPACGANARREEYGEKAGSKGISADCCSNQL